MRVYLAVTVSDCGTALRSGLASFGMPLRGLKFSRHVSSSAVCEPKDARKFRVIASSHNVIEIGAWPTHPIVGCITYKHRSAGLPYSIYSPYAGAQCFCSRKVTSRVSSIRCACSTSASAQVWQQAQTTAFRRRPGTTLPVTTSSHRTFRVQRNLATTSSALAAAASDRSGHDETSQAPASLTIRVPDYCCGCGVRLQDLAPNAPGFYQIPKFVVEQVQARKQDEQPEPEVSQSIAPASAFEKSAEAWVNEQQRPSDTAPVAPQPTESNQMAEPDILCARCHSLRHTGRIKNVVAEAALPAFDLGKVGRKIHLQQDRRATVLCVVDITDFHGSLAKLAIQALVPPATAGATTAAAQQDKIRLMVAVNKVDLLPQQVSPARLEAWVRQQLAVARLPKPTRVFPVSAVSRLGLREMLDAVRESLGFRGDLWVVGAQNAGKSSLLTALKRLAGTAKSRPPTVAAMPGTTLGVLRVDGLGLDVKQRAFDTPGVPHPQQLTSYLDPEEVRMVLPTRRMKPRTYRTGAGSSILIGGLARIDIVACPTATLYATIFASDLITLHLGQTETAAERQAKHGGGLLVPPVTAERCRALGPLVPNDVTVDGDSWQGSSTDVYIAGLGWVAVGLKGTAQLRVWAPEGVAVGTCRTMVPDFAKVFDRPGFSVALPQAPSKAGKQKAKPKGKKVAATE